MGRHFQVAPDCDSKNLQMVYTRTIPFPKGGGWGTRQRPPRTNSISLDLLEFILKLFVVAQLWTLSISSLMV